MLDVKKATAVILFSFISVVRLSCNNLEKDLSSHLRLLRKKGIEGDYLCHPEEENEEEDHHRDQAIGPSETTSSCTNKDKRGKRKKVKKRDKKKRKKEEEPEEDCDCCCCVGCCTENEIEEKDDAPTKSGHGAFQCQNDDGNKNPMEATNLTQHYFIGHAVQSLNCMPSELQMLLHVRKY